MNTEDLRMRLQAEDDFMVAQSALVLQGIQEGQGHDDVAGEDVNDCGNGVNMVTDTDRQLDNPIQTQTQSANTKS